MKTVARAGGFAAAPAIVVVDAPDGVEPGFAVVVDADAGAVSIVVVVAFVVAFAVAEPFDVSDFFLVVVVTVDFFFVVVVADFFFVVALCAEDGAEANAATITTPARANAPERKAVDDEVVNLGKPMASRYWTGSNAPGC